MCDMAGFVCGGYGKAIYFDFEDGSNEARYRRPLLTMDERKRMSETLVKAVPPPLASWHLSQIDQECDEASVSDQVQISRGPFGAFKVSTIQEAPISDLASQTDVQPQSDQQDDVGMSDLLQQEIMELPSRSPGPSNVERLGPCPLTSMVDWFAEMANRSFLEHNLPATEEPIFEWCDLAESLSPSRVQDFFQDTTLSMQQTSTPQCTAMTSTSLASLSIPSPDSIAPSIDCAVPHDAVFLLKHYTSTVLRGLTPYRHGKTPWHVLFIPHVKNCLAALTLGEDVDHASKCIFFGTLAMSAFSLASICSSTKWLHQGRAYQNEARTHIRDTLRTAYNVPKAAKYKSILMAILTMMQMSLLFGDQDHTEFYILEAERFIRIRGLNRKKSRKVRLLHHCYAYERLIYESTVPDSRVNTIHRHNIRKAIESSDAVAYSLDSLTFQLGGGWKHSDETMLQIKGQDEGENDLHLEHPGIWPATLYPEIFGTAEMHIAMLSLSIRLRREKGRKDEPRSGVSLHTFLTSAKAIETFVNQPTIGQSSWTTNAPSGPDHRESIILLDNLSSAMQFALSIYFYRKVYDLDRSMVQRHVESVRDCLEQFDAADSGQGCGSLRLVWPAFTAACEAQDVGVRGIFSVV